MKPLALIDVMDGDVARHSLPVFADAEGGATVRIGRSLACDLVLDDPHLAAEHAELRIEASPVGRLSLLPSLNGGWAGSHPLRAGTTVDWVADAVLQLGHTRLRLRHAAAALAPEAPPVQTPSHRWVHRAALPLLLLLSLVWFLAEVWLRVDPGSTSTEYTRPVMALALAMVLWAGFWSLLTQVFQRRFPFGVHLKRTLVVVLAAALGEELLTALAFVLSWPALHTLNAWIGPFALAGLTVWQGQLALPRRQRWVRALALSGLALWLAMSWVTEEGAQYRWRSPYMATMLPPAWRLAPLEPVDSLLEEAARLEPELAAKAKRDPKGREEDPD